MKRRYTWTLAAVCLVAAVGGLVAGLSSLLRGREPEWTTRSKAALEEFEKGLEQEQRGYRGVASERYDRALELDPKFVAAKVFLCWLYPPNTVQAKELSAEIAAADLGALNPRERFLARFLLAERSGEAERATEILDRFLDEHPDDPYGLDYRCRAAWWNERWDDAEACYESLLERRTNEVEAYYRLGFIAMAQGHFTEAEKHFQSYGFIAPDQSRPYVSLAELLILLGRYEEAVATLEKAFEIEPDSCEGHRQLVRAYYFSGRWSEADVAVGKMAGLANCAMWDEAGYTCAVRATLSYFAGELEEAWSRFEGDCLARQRGINLVAHHVAVATGRLAAAREMAELVRRQAPREHDQGWSRSLLAHFEGVQAMAEGDYGRASRRLRDADEELEYWVREKAGFKLLNRTFLARSLALEGRVAEAQAMRRKVEAVNPRFFDHLPELSFLRPAER